MKKQITSGKHTIIVQRIPSILSIVVVSIMLCTTTLIGKSPVQLIGQSSKMQSYASSDIFSASPNPIQVCAGNTGNTTLSWTIASGTEVEVRKGGETGPLLVQANSSGSQYVSGVEDGAQYFLFSVTTRTVITWRYTNRTWQQVPVTTTVRSPLSQLTITHTNAGCATTPPSTGSTPVAGTVRGVTFFYLDGINQDFPWVLENQYNPAVRAKIDGVLAGYRQAGVNWIRLLVSANHRGYYKYLDKTNPVPDDSLVRQVNDFTAITRSGENAGKFNIELMLIAQTDTDGLFMDAAPSYSKDKQWYASWISKLNYSNIGLVMFGGDLQPCGWEPVNGFKCGDASSRAIVKNHAKWIVGMWNWLKQTYPNLNVNYEVIGGGDVFGMLLNATAKWQLQNTPSIPATAASIYFDLPPGSTSQQYATTTRAILDYYKVASTKPLWIDEYGKSISTQYSITDHANYTAGFLATAVCGGYGAPAGIFAWHAGYDSSYQGVSYGYASGFSGNNLVWRPAWASVQHYYTTATCP